MSIDRHTVAHRWFDEVWNHSRQETIDELYASDAIAHGLGEGTDSRGPAGFRASWCNMRSALPDAHISIEDTIIQGDKAVVRVALEGTHRGEGLGLPATGRRVSVTGIVIIRIDGGQIAASWNNWDQLGLLRQLGAIPAAQGPDRFLSTQA
jgi:steroid delta-isomerase-like uncharacterized protein